MVGSTFVSEHTVKEILTNFVSDPEAVKIWFNMQEDKVEIIKEDKNGRVFVANIDFNKKEVVVTEDAFGVLDKAKFDDIESMRRFIEDLEERVRTTYEYKKAKVLDTVKKIFGECVVDVVRDGYLLNYESIVTNLVFKDYPSTLREEYYDVFGETTKADVIYYIYKLIVEFVEATEKNDLEGMIITSTKAKFIIGLYVKYNEKVLQIFESLVMKIKLLRLELGEHTFIKVVDKHLRILETILKDVLGSGILSKSGLFVP